MKEEKSPWDIAASSLAMTEESRNCLSEMFQNAGEETVDRLLDAVDQSDYSLDDWAEAMGVFEDWLTRERVSSRPLPEMIGYVHCCTLTNAPGVPLASLKVIVGEALIDFGFDVISESQF